MIAISETWVYPPTLPPNGDLALKEDMSMQTFKGMGTMSGGNAREVIVRNHETGFEFAVVLLPTKRTEGEIRVVRVRSNLRNPTLPTFTLELVDPEGDADAFVESRWWTLDQGKQLISSYLGRAPSAPVQFPVKQEPRGSEKWEAFCEMHHYAAVEKGPCGFLPMYGLDVLAAAVSAAFDHPMDYDDPPFDILPNPNPSPIQKV